LTIHASLLPNIGAIPSVCNSAPEHIDPEEDQKHTEPAVSGIRLYIDQGSKFSSNSPNEALMFALVDGSAEGREEREQAQAIIEGWKPAPWKGMVWRGPVGQDRVWSGREWMHPELIREDFRPLAYAAPSKVSERLTNVVRFNRESSIEAAELNQAYDTYLTDPAGEEDSLSVTILAFIRSRERLAQCRNLLMPNPEIGRDVDDIFMEFYTDLRSRMANEKYQHQGKFDRWINVIWSRYFFAGIKQEVYEYLDTTRIVNNLDSEGPGYRFEDHCVNTTNLTSDASDTRGIFTPVSRFIRELSNRDNPLFVMTECSKQMLIGALQGETRQQAAQRLDIHPRHALRLLDKAKSECQEILGIHSGDEFVGDIQGASDSEDCDNIVCIQASAGEPFEPLLGVPEAAKLLCVHPKTVQAMARAGTIPCTRIGKYWRFRASVLDVWVREAIESSHQSRRVA
jgi:excisionase family DNA binding protein